MYEINNMGLRYTLICVVFQHEYRFASTTANIESKIGDFLKEKKAMVGVAVLTDRNKILLHNNKMNYPLLSVFKFHVALTVLDKMNKQGTH